MFAHIFSWSLPQQNFTTESLVEKLFLSLSLSSSNKSTFWMSSNITFKWRWFQTGKSKKVTKLSPNSSKDKSK